MESLKREIEELWLQREMRSFELSTEKRAALDDVVAALDCGKLRVATRRSDASGPEAWEVHEWLKKAILLFLRFTSARLMGEATETPWWDKMPSKFSGWKEEHFQKTGFRAVPPCFVRRGAFIGRDAVLMPSYVNVGAYVDEKTMVDTWATIGSCAQIGKNTHISGGAGIGGVLEPLQARPSIVEDDCFIGARSEIAEGVVIGRGSVLSMGVFLSASTRIIDRKSGKIWRGFVPPYSVVVPGSLPSGSGDSQVSLYCAVIVKTVDAGTREKTSINELLRGE